MPVSAQTGAHRGHDKNRDVASGAKSQTIAPQLENTKLPPQSRGTRGPTDVQVGIDHWTGTFSDLSNIASSLNSKFAWGNRIPIPPDLAPFTITGVVSLTLEYTSSGAPTGLQTGEPIEILIFSDASGTGPAAAKLIYRQTTTFKTFLDPQNPSIADITYQLDQPVTVSQGDVYVMFVDRTTDTGDNTGTVIPYLGVDNGGTNFSFSLMARVADATNLGSYRTIENTFTDGPQGEFIIRLVGHQAAAGTPVTNDLEPTDATLPAPSNLTGTSAGTGGTLNWTAPTLTTPTPTNVNEVEPNDSPATAQNVGVNVIVSGADKSSDNGAPGGFGGDDVEDWYSFTLTAPTSVQISLSNFGAANDFDLLLYNQNGPFDPDNPVASSGNAAGEDELIDVPVLAPGTYVVAVSAFDPGVAANQTYKLQITAAPKVLRYNIYCGIGAVTPSADTFFGTAPGDATSFTIGKSSPGAVYVVTAVIGASQTSPTNSATLGACAGGPTISSVKKISLKKAGKISLTGSGFVAGMTVLVNGVNADPANLKVKKQGAALDIKGPLANGQPISSVVTSGQPYTVTILLPNGGCTSFTATAP